MPQRYKIILNHANNYTNINIPDFLLTPINKKWTCYNSISVSWDFPNKLSGNILVYYNGDINI